MLLKKYRISNNFIFKRSWFNKEEGYCAVCKFSENFGGCSLYKLSAKLKKFCIGDYNRISIDSGKIRYKCCSKNTE